VNVFTEVYARSVELVKAPTLDPGWTVVETDLEALLETDGPNVDKAGVLDSLRRLREEAGKGKPVARAAVSAEILRASKPSVNGYQDRAALLKTMAHFYVVQRKGARSIWVLDPPRAYDAWPYDLPAGKPETEVKTALEKDAEVFGPGNRQMMSDALQLARKWAADAQVKLASPNAATPDTVKRWFFAAGASEADVVAAVAAAAVLAEGFKKIHAGCNSSRVIFSDRPHLRASGEWESATTTTASNPGPALPRSRR